MAERVVEPEPGRVVGETRRGRGSPSSKAATLLPAIDVGTSSRWIAGRPASSARSPRASSCPHGRSQDVAAASDEVVAGTRVPSGSSIPAGRSRTSGLRRSPGSPWPPFQADDDLSALRGEAHGGPVADLAPGEGDGVVDVAHEAEEGRPRLGVDDPKPAPNDVLAVSGDPSLKGDRSERRRRSPPVAEVPRAASAGRVGAAHDRGERLEQLSETAALPMSPGRGSSSPPRPMWRRTTRRPREPSRPVGAPLGAPMRATSATTRARIGDHRPDVRARSRPLDRASRQSEGRVHQAPRVRPRPPRCGDGGAGSPRLGRRAARL